MNFRDDKNTAKVKEISERLLGVCDECNLVVTVSGSRSTNSSYLYISIDGEWSCHPDLLVRISDHGGSLLGREDIDIYKLDNEQMILDTIKRIRSIN